MRWPAACRRCPRVSRAPSSSPRATSAARQGTLAGLIGSHTSEPAAATLLTTTLTDPTGYGRILRTQDREVIAIVEQTDATESQRAIGEVNAGVYAFDIEPLHAALSRLRSNNAQHELYLTDAVSIIRESGKWCTPIMLTTAHSWPG